MPPATAWDTTHPRPSRPHGDAGRTLGPPSRSDSEPKRERAGPQGRRTRSDNDKLLARGADGARQQCGGDEIGDGDQRRERGRLKEDRRGERRDVGDCAVVGLEAIGAITGRRAIAPGVLAGMVGVGARAMLGREESCRGPKEKDHAGDELGAETAHRAKLTSGRHKSSWLKPARK